MQWTQEGGGLFRGSPTLRGKAATSRNLNPKETVLAAGTDNGFWKKLTGFAKIEVDFAREVRDIKEQWQDKALQPLSETIDKLQGLPLLVSQWFTDAKRVAQWTFHSAETGRISTLHSGEKQGTTLDFQDAWYQQVEQLIPDVIDREIMIPELMMLGNQAALATNTVLIHNLVGAHKQFVQGHDPGDQGYTVITEKGKVILEGHQKFYLRNLDNMLLVEGEATTRFRTEIGSPSLRVTIDKIQRYPKPIEVA